MGDVLLMHQPVLGIYHLADFLFASWADDRGELMAALICDFLLLLVLEGFVPYCSFLVVVGSLYLYSSCHKLVHIFLSVNL